MFVLKFSVEDWQGTPNHSSLQPVECWPDIEAAIQELDGQHKTLAYRRETPRSNASVSVGMKAERVDDYSRTA
jgi:hypothetical protein